MQTESKVWLDSNPDQSASWQSSAITESEDLQGGGMWDIINYIIRDESPDEPLSRFKENIVFFYNKGDEVNDFKDNKKCIELIRNIDNELVVGLPAEAKFITSVVFKYIQRQILVENEELILNYLYEEGWSEEQIQKPQAIATEIIKSKFKSVTFNTELVQVTSDYIAQYFEIRANLLQKSTIEQAVEFFCNNDLSNKKYKAIVRAFGAQNTDVQKLIQLKELGNTSEIKLYIKDLRKNAPGIESNLKKLYQANGDLKDLIGNNTSAMQKLIRKSAFAQKIGKMAFKFGAKAPLIDAVITLYDAQKNPEDLMDNLLISGAAAISSSVGFGVTVFVILGKQYWERMEQETFDAIYAACGIDWYVICNHQYNPNTYENDFKLKQVKYFLLLYKREEHKLLKNSRIAPTSIRITNASKAEQIFGFKPLYVNYSFIQNDDYEDICCTRYK